MKQALKQQGFVGVGRKQTEWADVDGTGERSSDGDRPAARF